jgi:hypothetical protein
MGYNPQVNAQCYIPLIIAEFLTQGICQMTYLWKAVQPPTDIYYRGGVRPGAYGSEAERGSQCGSLRSKTG